MEYGLSLGTNLGDRLRNLRAARASVAGLAGVELVASSPVYETEPVDVAEAYRHTPFLNAVLIVRAAGDPHALAAALHAIEDEMGRVRTSDRNAPRVIDVDVLYAEGCSLPDVELTLPHPRWAARRFVVQPLADVRPDLRLPGETRTVREVLLSLPAEPAVVLLAEEW